MSSGPSPTASIGSCFLTKMKSDRQIGGVGEKNASVNTPPYYPTILYLFFFCVRYNMWKGMNSQAMFSESD